MKKIIALFLTLTMLFSVASFAAAEQKQVLTVTTWDAATTGYIAATEAAFEAANPDVDVQFIDLASQDYAIKTTTMLAGGDTTDVYDVKELSDLQNWIAQGYVEDLEPMIAADKYDLAPYVGMEASYRGANGSLYALPYRSDFWVLFYNKTLFDAAKLEYPTNDMTWEQYAEIAKKMTSGTDGVDKIFGTHYHTWLSAVGNWAVCDGVNTLADGEYSDLKYFYELYQGLEDGGNCMTYDDLKASGLHYSGAFAQGNIAMMPMGYWFAATMIQKIRDGEANFDWSLVAVPHQETVAAGSSFGSLTGAAVNINSANKDLAWKFISWRAGFDGASMMAKAGARPAYVSAEIAAVMASAEGFPKDEAATAALIPAAMSLEWPIGDKVSEIKTIVNEEHSLIMTREVTIDEGIQNMNDRVAELLGK